MEPSEVFWADSVRIKQRPCSVMWPDKRVMLCKHLRFFWLILNLWSDTVFSHARFFSFPYVCMRLSTIQRVFKPTSLETNYLMYQILPLDPLRCSYSSLKLLDWTVIPHKLAWLSRGWIQLFISQLLVVLSFSIFSTLPWQKALCTFCISCRRLVSIEYRVIVQ